MRIADGFDDRQPKARSTGTVLAGTGAIDTEKAFKHVRECLGRNADAVVDHIEYRTALFPTYLPEPDAAAVGCGT